ncbi:FtsX-like permease family protein [Salinibacter grassmerensis]|uniref:FtsX-like permease family protein n=1 Tax=Salinibacter grassmerensis TaxID=3040353 RepID=UPI0021E8CCCC|nr:FtsX-like permease family protein [Salinibacter grassmerensis]
MDYRLQIARRYLASRREVSLISIITGISTVGVTLGVASLIVVLSVMNGFYDVVRDLLVSLDPHVRVVSAEGQGVANADSLLRVARETRHVTAAAPYVEGKALLMSDNTDEANRVVRVRGVEASMMKAAAPTMAMGRFDLSRSADEVPGIVLNQRLGQRAGLVPARRTQSASAVGLLSAPAVERTLTNIFGSPPVQRFEVRGLFQSQGASESQRVFVSLEEAQQLFRTEGRVTGVELRLDNLERAAGVKAALQQKLGTDQYTVQTWYDLQRSLYDVMQLEKWGASAILGLIVIVAAFNIVGSLTMVVIEKRADVGALQAMGVSRGDVRRIFLLEGALVGALGTGLGLVLGLGLAFVQQYYGIVPMAQAESFLIDAYPVSVQALDVALIAVVSFGLCVLAALYPAARAAAIEPARAVHLDG